MDNNVHLLLFSGHHGDSKSVKSISFQQRAFLIFSIVPKF